MPVRILKRVLRTTVSLLGFDLYRIPRQASTGRELRIPDAEYYQPLFSPWMGYGEFSKYYDLAKQATLVSADRCWVLYALCRQSIFVEGNIWECGVYRGGTAAMLAQILHDYSPTKRLHLFDTFEGMPETDRASDLHEKGDFSDTTLEKVRQHVKHADITEYHKGLIPDAFAGLERSVIAFAHVDVDIRQSVADCCDFIFPRLSVGGFIVFDDYGFPGCPGSRQAVDAYFSGRSAVPLVLPTGQAVVFKSTSY